MSLKAGHVGRYQEIARLLVKHARLDRRLSDGSSVDDLGEARAAAEADAEQLAQELEAMGPTFVKLGQLLSTRSDLLPPVYLRSLSRLQDRVEPLPFDVVRRVVSEELGVRLESAFAEFSHEPRAAASLGQVHRAVLPSGRVVAVKVQRPDAAERALDDMEVIEELAGFADAHTDLGRRYGFSDMAKEFRESLTAELDYHQEARNLRAIGAELGQFPNVVVPEPVDDYTTGKVLTMDWIEGRNVASLGPLGLQELDGAALADDLLRAYLDQMLVAGTFHADPHPGNVLVTTDGRLGLVDLGMVATVAPETQDQLIKLLLAVSSGRGATAADVMIELGDHKPGFDRDGFRRAVMDLVSRNRDLAMGDVQAGALLGRVLQAAGESGLRAPSELTMLGKALLNLDEVTRVLDPAFEPNAVIERHAADLMRHKMLQSASPTHVLSAAMEAKEFAEKLPGRVNKVMDALAEGQLTLNVQGIDEQELMRGIQKLANRVAAGVVVAALVVGAALLSRVDARPKLMGYPALATVMFLLAAAAAAGLLASIALSDLPQHRRWRRRLRRDRKPRV